jgi:hypothetical protein
MPTKPSKARKLIASGKATPFWNKGIFCIRLNYVPQRIYIQPVVVGVDPGSKREGLCVKSEAYTHLNIQTTTPNWVSKKVEERQNLRRTRRYRKAPYRANRQNRARGGIPPSTRARWQWKLRVINWLAKMYPIDTVAVEDIKAETRRSSRRWNTSFSPLEVGKKWFYGEIEKRWRLMTYGGWETCEERQELGLKKAGNKLSDSFYAHCVDAWCLANMWVGGHREPDNTDMLYLYPLKLHRRNLHRQNPSKGGVRKPYGGTQSLGAKRGSWVKHPKFEEICYVGGHTSGRISLHSLETGKRIYRSAKVEDLKFLCYSSWRVAQSGT